MPKKQLTDYLKTWSALNLALLTCSEQHCIELIQAEQKAQHRNAFLLRIYGRYNRLRGIRERSAILSRKSFLEN